MKYKNRQSWIVDNELTIAPVFSRVVAILIDLIIITLLLFGIVMLLSVVLKVDKITFSWEVFKDFELHAENKNESILHALNISLGFFPNLYFFLFPYFTNGLTIGKKIMGIRIIGIYHRRLNLWHSLERSLGYLASALELGLGYIQVFWNPNRMTLHDKIAETLVIRIRKPVKAKKKGKTISREGQKNN
jgi:uncharacterized RDD family membrane protein YckC